MAVQIFALFSGFGGCMWLPLNHTGLYGDNERDRVQEKDTMVFRQCSKFVADLNLGCCSLGAEGSNICSVEATP